MEKAELFAITKQSLVQKRQKFEVHYNILEVSFPTTSNRKSEKEHLEQW